MAGPSLPPGQLGYANDPTADEFRESLTEVSIAPQAKPVDPFEVRCRAAKEAAQEAFVKTQWWVVLYRALLGREGVVRQLFPDNDDFQRFIDTEEHAEILEMIAAMRSADQSKGNAAEPERMITIRIPMSLHEVLKEEAEQAELSINKICLGKLLRPNVDRFTPVAQGQRRGRRPGPQGRRGGRTRG